MTESRGASMKWMVGLSLALLCAGAAARAEEDPPVGLPQIPSLDAAIASLEPPMAAPGKMAIEDLRAPADKKNHLVSGFLFDCDNGVWVLGDAQVAADRIARLEAALVGAFGEDMTGQKLTVRRYVVFLNGHAYVEGETYKGTSGLAFDLMKSTTHLPDPKKPGPTLQAKCSQEKTKVAWFATSEITNENSPLVTEIDVTLAGRDYAVRSVYSPEFEMWTQFSGGKVKPALAAYVQKALAKANAAVVAEVRKARAAGTGAPATAAPAGT